MVWLHLSRHRKLIVRDQGVILATSQAQPGAGEVGSECADRVVAESNITSPLHMLRNNNS